MKKFTSYLLISLFVFRAFEVGVIYVNFKINQDYIAEVLCINKDKPELKCNGCCQLKKELTEQHDREEKSEETFIPEKTLVYTNSNWQLNYSFYPNTKTIILSSFIIRWLKKRPVDIFHPPENLI